MNIRELQKQSWQVAEDHGFHKAQEELPPKTLALYLRLFLAIGEFAEAGEELRAGRAPNEVYFRHRDGDYDEVSDYPWSVFYHDGNKAVREFFLEPPSHQWLSERDATLMMGKPEGFGIELADALIRLCDTAEDAGVDLTEMTKLKESYNRTREFMHGKTA